tara:strand:- start:145 stop:540 length:396 start_codon:yes stop_codon:yes gene_type:complete
MQTQGMQRTQDALSAYGMAPQNSQYQSSLPEQTSMGGVSGYSSGNLFDAAVAELAMRNPEMAARYASAMAPIVRPPPPPAPVGILGNVANSSDGGYDSGGYTDGGNGVGVNGGPVGSGGGNAADGFSFGGW